MMCELMPLGVRRMFVIDRAHLELPRARVELSELIASLPSVATRDGVSATARRKALSLGELLDMNPVEDDA